MRHRNHAEWTKKKWPLDLVVRMSSVTLEQFSNAKSTETRLAGLSQRGKREGLCPRRKGWGEQESIQDGKIWLNLKILVIWREPYAEWEMASTIAKPCLVMFISPKVIKRKKSGEVILLRQICISYWSGNVRYVQ